MPGKKYYFWIRSSKSNFKYIKVLVVFIIGIFILRLGYMQLFKGSYYYRKTEKNRIQYYPIEAPRGRIFDRNGIILAGNQPEYSLYVSVGGLNRNEVNEIVRKIHFLTGRSMEKMTNRFQDPEKRLPFDVINVAANLSKEEIITIEENIHNLQRTSIQIESRRKYPFGENCSHILGYIGEISDKELQDKKKYGYKLKDRIGKSGAEKVYDKVLRGREGFKEVEVSATGGQKSVIRTVNPKIGSDIMLTLDWELQNAASRAMKDETGVVVAADPRTGEILIWLSKPGFDPEDFVLPMSEKKLYRVLKDPKHPLFNRAIQGRYAPGSLFKLVTASAAMELADIGINKKYECRGSIKIGYDRKVFRCWKQRKHGELNLIQAIANSCNVYFYQLGLDVGAENIYAAAKRMGFGERAQHIFKNEKKGFVPNPQWNKADLGKEWYPGDTANMSVGQGYVLVNPLQILKMVSFIAAGGDIYEPHVLKLVISPQGEVEKRNMPEKEGKVNLPLEAINNLKAGMIGVTEYGTAKYLNAPVKVAAKTGTSENPIGEDDAWFACFAPAEDPQIAIVVLVENGGYGSVSAMPVAREILKRKFSID